MDDPIRKDSASPLRTEDIVFDWLMENFGQRIDDIYQPLTKRAARLMSDALARRLGS